MRVVPANRVLIQPTIQYRWLEQHKTIEFSIDAELMTTFLRLWQFYLEQHCPAPVHFFNLLIEQGYELYDQDALFSLLSGAIYAHQQEAPFSVGRFEHRLTWSIDHC